MRDDGPSKFTVVASAGGGAGGTPAARRREPSTVGETATTGPAERTHLTVILSEGRNRQIRRTFAALGYRVVTLHRTQFGKYQLSGLKPGKYVTIKA